MTSVQTFQGSRGGGAPLRERVVDQERKVDDEGAEKI